MIQVIVMMTVDPRQAGEIIRAFQSLKLAMQSVRGLICLHIYTNAEASNSLLYVEEWKTPEDLGQGAVVAHFTRLFGLMERAAETPVLCVNSISNTGGIEYLDTFMKAGRVGSNPNTPSAKHKVRTKHSTDGRLP